MIFRNFFIFSITLLISINCLPKENFLTILEDQTLISDSLNDNPLINVRCFWINGLNLYDISGLQRKDQRNLNFTTKEGDLVYYNFCSNIYPVSNCTTQTTMVGIDNFKSCNQLASDADTLSEFKLINSTNPNGGLIIKLGSGEKCKADESKNYTVTYKISCNEGILDGNVNFINTNEFSLHNCENTLIGSSYQACPKMNYYIIEYFLSQYSYFFGVFIMLIGFFLMVLGAHLIKATLFTVAVLTSITLVMTIFFNIFTASTTSAVWIVLIVGLFIGLGIAYSILSFIKTLYVLVGGYLGYVLSLFIYNLALEYIKADPKLVYWGTTVSCILIVSLIALWLSKHILILGTSIIGAFAVIRGASLYIGHFPNESVLIDLIQHQEWKQLEQAFEGCVYIYLVVWVVLSILSILWQYKFNKDKDDDHYTRLD